MKKILFVSLFTALSTSAFAEHHSTKTTTPESKPVASKVAPTPAMSATGDKISKDKETKPEAKVDTKVPTPAPAMSAAGDKMSKDKETKPEVKVDPKATAPAAATSVMQAPTKTTAKPNMDAKIEPKNQETTKQMDVKNTSKPAMTSDKTK